MWVRAIVLSMVAGTVAAQQAQSLDYPALLARLIQVDWLWRTPATGERCVQFSSYDRRSREGPGKQAAWYANDDRGQYLRVDEREGGKEYVLAEAEGPGCVARLWSANPSGLLHFDIDGERVWSVDFAKLCSGAIASVPEPLAAMRSRGGNVYLPIPFGKRLRVAATAGDLYYHVDVLQFAAGTTVPGFTPDLLVTQAAAVAAVAKELGEPGRSVRTSALSPPLRVPAQHVVRALQLLVEHTGAPADVAGVLRRTRLQIRSGRESLVDVPVTDFFAGGPDWRSWGGEYLGVDASGSGYCCLPMPFVQAGSIEVVTEGAHEGIELRLATAMQPMDLPADTLLFRASYHQTKATPTRPFSDHLVLDAKGKGRFVGCSLCIQNPSRIWWGEGDEKCWIDGETFPSWFGTGTEDYFGYAWCDPTPFEAPFHAQVQCDGPMTFGCTQLHRTHVLDSVPFQRSFRFEFERWHWVEDIKMNYATVAYWYGAPGAASGLPPVPATAEREWKPLPAPVMFVAANAVEGEVLPVLRCSGGTHEVQDLSFFEKTFSRDAHRWWRDGNVGDELVLALPVAKVGRYRVTLAIVQADDFGIVQVSLGGRALGPPLDGYAERVRSSGPQVLGVAELAAGSTELRLQLVGNNDKAKPRHMVGLDYVQLEIVE